MLVKLKYIQPKWLGLRGYVVIATEHYAYKFPTTWSWNARKLYNSIKT